MVISNCNPMKHIITHQFLGGKYFKWIVILQEFDLEFRRTKSKKYFMFDELICDLPCSETENVAEDSLPDESVFLISSDDLWYGDIVDTERGVNQYQVQFKNLFQLILKPFNYIQ
jgi:hypothetical protein